MALILDEIGVCNMALDLIKVDPITNIRDAKTNAEAICARWYDTDRRQVLNAHPWNFAKARFQCSLDTVNTPLFEFDNAYNLPNDYIRLRFIGDENLGLVGIDYQIEGKQILINNSDASSLDIGYIRDETTISRWSELAKNYLANLMAYHMSYAFSGKTLLRKDIKAMLDDNKIEAKAVNGQNNPPKRITRSKVIGARRTFGTGYNYRGDPTIITGN